MGNNIIIEKMTLDDLDSISSVLKSDFDNFWNYNILKSELENPNSLYFVCKKSGEIIGFAGITTILDTAELNNIVIKKSFRGKHFSSLLLKKIINECINKNCKKINLEVSASNKIAISLYKKYGFVQVGLRKNYYTDQDALLYTKIIENP